jgi:predicted alpha-1,2-mannosidase
VKGLAGINWKDAYAILKHDADFERKGYEGSYGDTATVDSVYCKTGWIPAGIMSCSKTLEYAYNDYCAAEMAKSLGTMADYRNYLDRSSEWENLWDSSLTSDGFNGFIAPREANGTWVGIDPKKEWGSWHKYFYEGSSWTYSYFVPHQFGKLVELCGGKEKYAARLNHALEEGLIDYSNEPAFLAIHTFHYASRSDLASLWVRRLMKTGYTMSGYPGNDDSGAMGSWFVFAAMGFFPNAGQNLYYLHGPAFSKCIIHLESGKLITIIGENASDENIYVKSLKVNEKLWNSPFITYGELKNGAILDFIMDKTPSNQGK